MTVPVSLQYDVYLMPRGRVNFRRWHWEIWDGTMLLAAGWQTDPLRAQRSVRVHAVRFAHRTNGVRVIRPDAGHEPETPWGRRRLEFRWGEMEIELTPRARAEARQSA